MNSTETVILTFNGKYIYVHIKTRIHFERISSEIIQFPVACEKEDSERTFIEKQHSLIPRYIWKKSPKITRKKSTATSRSFRNFSNQMDLIDGSYELDINPKKVCRLCLSQSIPLQNIFSNSIVDGYITSVPEMLDYTVNITVTTIIFRSVFYHRQRIYFSVRFRWPSKINCRARYVRIAKSKLLHFTRSSGKPNASKNHCWRCSPQKRT